jgi:hypothetical protein
MEVSGQLHAPAALSSGKGAMVPIGQEAGWAPEPVWTRWWREKFPAPDRTRTPHYSAQINKFKEKTPPSEANITWAVITI